MMIDVKKIVNSKLNDRNILDPLVDKTFEQFQFKNNNYIEKDKFIVIINDIYKTLHLPPPSDSKIDKELNRLNRKKDGKLKKDEYRELIKDLIKVIIESL